MRDFILKRIAAVILPFVCVYGFYVIFHGHISPGGSFAGGIIVGLSYIAFSTIYGIEKGRAKIPDSPYVDRELWHTVVWAHGPGGLFKGVPFLANKLAGVHPGLLERCFPRDHL